MGNFILQNTEPTTTISQFLTSNIKYDGGALGNVPATTNSDFNTVLTDLNSTLASISSSFAGITGTGSKITKFTGASTIGDSLLSEAAKVVTLGGTTSTLNEFKINDSAKEVSLGVRGSGHSSGVTANGAQADAFVITGTGINGLNIIKNAGGGSEADYLRFYAGNTPTTTSRIHVTGKTSGAVEAGNVGINQEAPDKRLEVLDTSTQLRLTHTNASKFVDFTLDTNHDLLIKTSSTGQIKLQPTTDSVDFFQVLDADGGNPVLNVDATNERVGIGTAAPVETLDVRGSFRSTSVSIQDQGELKLLETTGGGTNYVSFRSPSTLAANTSYTLPTALPAITGYVLSSTDAGVMSWTPNTEPVVLYAIDLAELNAAFATLNAGTPKGGIIKLGADITLTGNQTWNFENGIEVVGGGNKIKMGAAGGTQYTITIQGVTGIFRSVQFFGDVDLADEASANNQACLIFNEATLVGFRILECEFFNLVGSTQASGTAYPVVFTATSVESYFEFSQIRIGTTYSGSFPLNKTKDYDSFKINYNDPSDATSGLRLMMRDWQNSAPGGGAYSSGNPDKKRWKGAKDSMRIKVDKGAAIDVDGKLPDNKRAFFHDNSVSLDQTSTFTNLEKYPYFDTSSEITTVAGSGAYLLGGNDINAYLVFTNAGATSPTIQPDSTIDLPIGSEIEIANHGAGTSTITRGSGVALYNPNGTDANYVIPNKYSEVKIKKIAADAWSVIASLGNITQAVAKTATADGTGTGTIADGTTFATITTADVAHIIILPKPIPGSIVWLGCEAESQAWELRSSAPSTIKINGGSGSNAESEINAGSSLVRCICVNATNWVVTEFATNGTESAGEAAA